MTIELKVYDNGDHTCLVWLPANAQAIPDCRGFAIHRTRKLAAGGAAQDTYIHGFVGFSDDDKLDPNALWKRPVQRYMWWDYLVDPGDEVQYSIIPVVGPDKDHLTLSQADASAQTPPMTITGQASAHISAYFNKGIVSAQWVTRALAAVGPDAKLNDLIGQPGNSLRNALSGMLRPQLLNMLADVKQSGGEIYAALYELNDPELIPALVALGQKCHLILANGAFNSKKHDENSVVRAQLHGKIDLHDRLVSSGHFAHNKFIVACDSSGSPQRVLSGSTNWTETGLCTQANNGIIVNDPDLGAHFIDQWNLLKAAGNAYPASLMQANATSKSFNVDGGSITQWFGPTDKGEDLDYARKLIHGAVEGILFLFFNQEIPGLTTEGSVKASKPSAGDPTNPSPVKLYDGGKTAPLPVPYDSMVPKAIKDAFHDWASEVMNQGVHVHSKVIVIDPFGKNPVVITGSHNLGYKASTKNDDNMMIVEDNAPLAASYAANIIAIYQTYRWNTYVDAHAKDPQVWHGLVDTATWQDSYLKPGGPDLAEIKFWLGEGVSASAPVAAAASGGTEVRAATASGPAPGAHRRPAAGKKPAKKATRAKSAPAKKASAKPRRVAAKKAPTKRTANPKATTRSKRAGARSAASKRKAAPVKRAPAKSRRAPAKKAPPKSGIARTKSTRAAATRRATRKITSRTPRRGR